MKLSSRETLYKARGSFKGVDDTMPIPSFPFSKPLTTNGYVSQSGEEMYFGCLSGVYSESPRKVQYQFGVSWDEPTQTLGSYFAIPSVDFSGVRLGGSVYYPVGSTFVAPTTFNGILVESFLNRTAIQPASFRFTDQEVIIEPVAITEELATPAVDRLVHEHIDIILDKLLLTLRNNPNAFEQKAAS